MGHHSCCNKQKVRRGLWSPEEDEKLIDYISTYGHGCWSSVPRLAGLQRCGKSCRLRWINYLRPDLKRGSFSPQEESLIIELHKVLGNRWAQIAKHLPGRTDNEVKNFWNSSIKKKLISSGAIADIHIHDSSKLLPSDGNIPLNIDPNLMTTPHDYMHLPAATSMPQGFGYEELKLDAINFNVDWFTASQPMEASSYYSTWYIDDHHHGQQQQRQEDYQCFNIYGNDTTAHYVQSEPDEANIKMLSDPSAATMMPRFCETVNLDEYSGPTSMAMQGVDPGDRLPYFPVGSYQCEPQVSVKHVDSMGTIMASSSSSSLSCGHIPINPSFPPNWEP